MRIFRLNHRTAIAISRTCLIILNVLGVYQTCHWRLARIPPRFPTRSKESRQQMFQLGMTSWLHNMMQSEKNSIIVQVKGDWSNQIKIENCSGCGSVGRAVSPNSRGHQFESSHRQNLFCIFIVDSIEKSKINKKRPNKDREEETDLLAVAQLAKRSLLTPINWHFESGHSQNRFLLILSERQ